MNPKELCSKLPPRQREVLILTCRGYQTAQVSAIMGVSCHTVNTYKKGVLARLGVQNMVAAAVIATKARLV